MINKLLDKCDSSHLSYVIEKEVVLEWFVESYRSGARSIKDYFDTWKEHERKSGRITMLEPDVDRAPEYIPRVVTKENEYLIYTYAPHECKVQVLVRYYSDDVFSYTGNTSSGCADALSYCISSAGDVLAEAYSVSKERLFYVIDLLLSLSPSSSIYKFYISCLLARPLSTLRGLLTMISAHYSVSRDDVLATCGNIESRNWTEKLMNDVFVDDV